MGLLSFLESGLVSRAALAAALQKTFGGKRDWNSALGYATVIKTEDYHERYERNSIAGRVVDAFPIATFRGTGGELIEDEDPDVVTPFESAWMEFAKRTHVWSILKRADILAGLGRFSIVVIGAPGKWQDPVTSTTLDNIAFLSPYGEKSVTIKTWETDANNARFGKPLLYSIRITTGDQKEFAREVHWSRVIHLSDGLLDDGVYGQPRLKRIWNDLDDLTKLTGGGSEAFWLRANQGLQFDIDKELKPSPEEKEKMKEEVDEYVHGMRRILRTRGVEVNTLGSDVADFATNAECVLSLISAGTSIPKRILLGSERGELASTQDRENWTERVQDRRDEYAGPLVVRQLVDRLISFRALPNVEYEVHWPAVNDLTDEQKTTVALRYAEINAKAGETVVTASEIRDWALGVGPLDPEDMDEEDDIEEDEDEDEELQVATRKAPRWMVERKIRCLRISKMVPYTWRFSDQLP